MIEYLKYCIFYKDFKLLLPYTSAHGFFIQLQYRIFMTKKVIINKFIMKQIKNFMFMFITKCKGPKPSYCLLYFLILFCTFLRKKSSNMND